MSGQVKPTSQVVCWVWDPISTVGGSIPRCWSAVAVVFRKLYYRSCIIGVI